MNGTLVHAAFDAAAWLAAGVATMWLTRCERIRFPASTTHLPYLTAILVGAAVGAYAFGTANLWLSGQPGVARSVEGALAGAIVAVELYKNRTGIRVRTGTRFALPLAIGIAIGRIGCFFAGLDDFTYGTPTDLPWGHDFGDGILRHPVQLYESAAIAAFAVLYVGAIRRRDPFIVANGFYLAVGFYGLQRFMWEFIKPYGALLGPITLFHLLSAAMIAYALCMIATAPVSTTDDRAFA